MSDKFSYCTLIYSGDQLEKAVSEISQAGYDGIELYPKDWEGKETGQLKRMIEQAGLEVSSVFGGVLSKDRHILQEAALIANTLGSKYVFAVSPVTGTVDRHTCFEILKSSARMLQDYDLTLLIHNHAGTYMDTIDKTIDLCSRIEEPNFGLCFDSVHFALFEDELQDKLDRLLPFVRYIHLKDMFLTRQQFAERVPEAEWKWGKLEHIASEYCDLNDGIIDNRAIAQFFHNRGYQGWWLPEIEKQRMQSDLHTRNNYSIIRDYLYITQQE